VGKSFSVRMRYGTWNGRRSSFHFALHRESFESHQFAVIALAAQSRARTSNNSTSREVGFFRRSGSWVACGTEKNVNAELLFLGVNLCTQALAAFLHLSIFARGSQNPARSVY
jgi:hypothetical protein